MQAKRTRNRQKAKCFRELEAVRLSFKNQQRLTEKYKKRYQRASKSVQGFGQKLKQDTPRTKTRKLLRNLTVPLKVKKTLVFHHALTSDLKATYREAKSEKERQQFSKIVTGKIIKHYRMQRWAQASLGFSRKRWDKYSGSRLDGHKFCFERKRKATAAGEVLKTCVVDFICRDDNSRMTPGKRQTLKMHRVKMQKWLLNESMLNIHRKFLAEHQNIKISYSLFCSLRPFWVVHPSLDDRETCQCKTHENLAFMTNKLYQLKILKTSNVEELADGVCCSSKSKLCAYGDCKECKLTVPEFNRFEQSEEVQYTQFRTVVEPLPNSSGQTVNITKKTVETTTKQDLLERFQNSLHKFRRHLFNIRHQFSVCRELRQNLTSSECIIHIDFSENFTGKFGSEIQSVHFGWSHKQVTLHTGVLYVGDIDQPITFCTLSPSRRHDPAAIWKYLEPLFEYLKVSHPDIEVIHFFSDGPTTQYRQKLNFFFFSTKLFELGYQSSSWNFWEASHGKGAPDSIGGAIKRKADCLISHGNDITDAATLYQALINETSIKLFFVEATAVEASIVPENLPAVPGTMKLHQLTTVAPGTITYRDVSCLCSHTSNCSCFNAKTFSFPIDKINLDLRSASSKDLEIPQVLTVEPVDQLPVAEDGRTAVVLLQPEMQSPDNHGTEKHQNLVLIDNLDGLVGEWCVVRYEARVYPGVVCSVEDTDVEVKCMSAAGKNRFFWPSREDVCWYTADNVLFHIPEPQKVGSRHMQIHPKLWDDIEQHILRNLM